MEWTPNDIVLSVQAYLDCIANPNDSGQIVECLAEETRRDVSAAAAGLKAIGNIDPAVKNGPDLTPFEETVARFLWDDRKEAARLVTAIRKREDTPVSSSSRKHLPLVSDDSTNDKSLLTSTASLLRKANDGLAQHRPRNACHTILVALFALLSLLLFTYVAWKYMCIDRSTAINRLASETSRFASGLFFQKMTTLAQLDTALLGGAWVYLVFAESRLKATETIVTFVIFNISLILSLFLYVDGHDHIVSIIFYHASFDIGAPFVQFIGKWQQYLFAYSCFSLIVTVLFRRRAT